MIWFFFKLCILDIWLVLIYEENLLICCSGKEILSFLDLVFDISFIKVEESDIGGLDMYVDISDDVKGVLLSSQDEGDDDTGEILYEWMRDEFNEGSNLSGE